MNLAENMRAAWFQRGQAAAKILNAADSAPGLFKPDAVEQARRDYFAAVREARRWSA